VKEPKKVKIAVVIPTLNEEKAIVETINAVPNPLVNQIMVVDGHSSDRTIDLVKQCHKPACGINFMYQKGKGKGMAFQSFLDSFDLDSQDAYVMLDADCTYDPQEIRKMVVPIMNGEADVVMGWRFDGFIDKKAMSPINSFGNKILTFVARLLYWKWNLKDLCTGYWVFSKDFLKKAKITAKGFDLEANLFAQAVKKNFRIKGVQVHYGERVGEKKLKMRDGIKIFWKLITERF
jgi:dolichol-phosphate mannosyltransferase